MQLLDRVPALGADGLVLRAMAARALHCTPSMGVQTVFGAARPEATRQDRVLNVSNVASNLPDGGRGIGQLFASTSIGVTVCSGDDADIDERIKQADMAMCRAKELGRGSDQFFSADLGAMAVARHEIVAGLRLALERGEFSIVDQPKADLASGRVFGVEALLRWTWPTRALTTRCAAIRTCGARRC